MDRLREKKIDMRGKEAQELLVSNPLLYSEMDKYIWINDASEEHGDA